MRFSVFRSLSTFLTQIHSSLVRAFSLDCYFLSMEAETSSVNQMPGIAHWLCPATGPVLIISMGYIDPGKWVAAVEGGARFGLDLLLPMFLFNCAAIFCQYLAASVGVVTEKNLAQICSEEYNMCTCFFLRVQAELSAIMLDLTTILGIAHGLNLLFGMDLFYAVFLSAMDVVLFPVLIKLLEKCQAEALFVSTAGFMLLSYVFGVLISQSDVPLVMNGTLTRLSGESVFTLMGLLGANVMPHNFYLHSSIVQRRGLPNVSKSALCHTHLVSIICIFGGVSLASYVLMNSAANVFHSSGLVVLTFQDALLLIDQVPPVALFLVMFISRQMTSITWSLGGKPVLDDLFRIDPPVWLHHATVRVLSIVLALYCAWSSGAEGTYQLLILSQVILAMLLPSSMIPLLRVASSGSIMEGLKISQFSESIALTTFIGMLGLNINFVIEMLFGYSDWVGHLRWNMGTTIAVPYVVLLFTACASLVFMLVLAVTPMKSASFGNSQQSWNCKQGKTLTELSLENDGCSTINCCKEEAGAEELEVEKSVRSLSDNSVLEADSGLPKTIVYSDLDPDLPAVEDHPLHPSSPTPQLVELTSASELDQMSIIDKEVFDDAPVDVYSVQNIEALDHVSETTEKERTSQFIKDDYEDDSWEREEPPGQVSGFGQTPTAEGPGSFRSLRIKSDEGGNGSGSLSRLSGLGRAARRQLAAILDEFWGHLYDFHGQVVQQAKAKKLDFFSDLDQTATAASLKVDSGGMAFSGYFPPVAGRSTFMTNSSMQDSPKQQMMSNNMVSPHGIQTGSNMWSTQMQVLDAYVKNAPCIVPDPFEKRYSSLRLPPLSEEWDYQHATIHGYNLSSYLSRIASESKSDFMNKSIHVPDILPARCRDTHAYAPGLKVQNGNTVMRTSSMQNPMPSGASMLHSERQYFDPYSSQTFNDLRSSTNTKKYHSLPDVSGLAVPRRDSYLADRGSPKGIPPGFETSIGRTTCGQSVSSGSGSRISVLPVFDELSTSKFQKDAFSVQLNPISGIKSVYSRQPSEQFTMVDKARSLGDDGLGAKPSSFMQETTHTSLETKLLHSLRNCIMKLLKLEGSDWLFKLNGGVDEDLIDLVANTERLHLEAETRDTNQVLGSPFNKFDSVLKNEGQGMPKYLVSSVPCCGEGCIWKVDLIVSFGVWCIHRILDLSFMESRPELWGKYTYVLNRLQGILDPAFSKPRSPPPPCFCLRISVGQAKKLIPPTTDAGRGKCTDAAMLLDLIKDVESAVSSRKGRTGTAAGEIAFPKGKENLASVLKRYKRRLSNRTVGTNEPGSRFRKVPVSASYAAM